MFTIHVKFQKKYIFKYQARKDNLTAGELKSFFCHNDESPFKLNDKHHLLYKPIEFEEAFISFFLTNGNEVKDDFIFSKDIKLKARLSIGAYFYPFQLDMNGHRSIIYVFMMKNTKISEIAKLFQNKLQLSPIKFKYSKSFSKPETMTSNASINSYKVSKFITIILPDFKTFGFRIEPNKVPLFYLNLSYKTPIKVIQGRVADEINKRFKIETHLTPQNIQLFLKKGHPLTNLSSQLKSLKEQDKEILVVIKDAVLPSNPSYLFLFPESSVPKLFELDNDVTVENFLNDNVSKSKEASLFCNGEKLKRNVKFSELGITMANLIIVKLKGSKTIITIKLPRETYQIKFKNFYQIRDLKEKVKEKIGSTPFDLYFKGKKLDEQKTCRDYGIDGSTEIEVHLLKTMSSSGSLLIYNDSSISIFDTPVEGNPVFFVAKDRRPLSHTFEKKATVAEAKEFIMASWMVKNIEFLLNGRFLSGKLKLSKLPISKKIPIAVIIKDQYNEVLEIKDSLAMSNNEKEIKIDMICENNGQFATFNVNENPTIGDVINSIKNKLNIGENQIEIVYHDTVYSDKKMLLSQIEKNDNSLNNSNSEDSEYIESLEQSSSDSDDSSDSNVSEEESESDGSEKNRKSRKSSKNENRKSDDDDDDENKNDNSDDTDDGSDVDDDDDDDNESESEEERKEKRKSKEEKATDYKSHRHQSNGSDKNNDENGDQVDKKDKRKSKEEKAADYKSHRHQSNGSDKNDDGNEEQIDKKDKRKSKEEKAADYKSHRHQSNGSDKNNDESKDEVDKKEKNKSKEEKATDYKSRRHQSNGGETKTEKSKVKDENETKKSKNKEKDENEAKKGKNKDKSKDDTEAKKSKNKSKDKDEIKQKDKDDDENDKKERNSSQNTFSDETSRDGNYFYFRLILEPTSTEQDYINLYSKFSNRHLRRVSKLKASELDGVPIMRDSFLPNNLT